MLTGSRRRAQTTLSACFVIAGLAISATACGSSGAQSDAQTTLPTTQSGLVAKSKHEKDLVIYGNPPTDYTKPLFEAFNKEYPWIKIQDFDLEDNQIFSKYQSEEAQGARTADLLIDSSAKLFLSAKKNGLIANTTPTGLSNFPSSVKLASGIYAMSLEPMLEIYNPKLLNGKKVPTSWQELASLAKSDPSSYKLITINMANATGLTSVYGLQHIMGDTIWSYLKDVAPATTTYNSAGDAVQQLAQGGGSVFFNGAGIFQGTLKAQYKNLLSYRFMTDGTPLIPRAIAMTSKASSPASAQLFMNFLYTQAGQEALCKVGFEATMNGFKSPSGCTASLSYLESQVKKSTIYTVPFSSDVTSQTTPITDRWNSVFK